ncbi:radical SAM protein [Anaerocolumna xylanovorans]|uniref:Radical SAM superfamily protein n=1 Tax=Anaerocolumna xylanovorans DSM 12503 TaxID=1121345 RepID=A0A1M7XXN5_9FIRM|nr:radical SAM protein [Anaerocolumna xylanovorans]SHO43663.1 Radical SAM superfamily protein [Anaerocolumna xylanovorans DSM 12503]
MHYSGVLNRPPYESDSILLEVTSGCSHNSCKFCSFYKKVPFRMSPMSEIEEDILEISRKSPGAERVFLQSAEPFVLNFEKLRDIGIKIRKHLPNCKSIGSYARITNFRNKSVEQLKELRKLGYDGLFIGVESGDNVLLDRMNKGYRAEEAAEQCKKLDEAEITYIITIINGLGGKGYGLDHAVKTAELFNQLHPIIVGMSQLTLFPDTPLNDDVKNGNFEEAGEKERLVELIEFVKRLEIPVFFAGVHVSVTTPAMGNLPKDKEKILAVLNNALINTKEEDLKEYRNNVRSL